MYDNLRDDKKRDSGFSIFYIFINVGAIFAPFTAIGVRNWWLSNNGFQYNAELPALCHSHLDGTINAKAEGMLQTMADAASGTAVPDLTAFANEYLNVFTTGFHYAFGVAIFALLISFVIYMANKNSFPNPKGVAKTTTGENAPEAPMMDIKEIKQFIERR